MKHARMTGGSVYDLGRNIDASLLFFGSVCVHHIRNAAYTHLISSSIHRASGLAIGFDAFGHLIRVVLSITVLPSLMQGKVSSWLIPRFRVPVKLRQADHEEGTASLAHKPTLQNEARTSIFLVSSNFLFKMLF